MLQHPVNAVSNNPNDNVGKPWHRLVSGVLSNASALLRKVTATTNKTPPPRTNHALRRSSCLLHPVGVVHEENSGHKTQQQEAKKTASSCVLGLGIEVGQSTVHNRQNRHKEQALIDNQ